MRPAGLSPCKPIRPESNTATFGINRNPCAPNRLSPDKADQSGLSGVSAIPVAQSMTASYSYRLTMNFGAGRQYETYLSNIRRPAALLVGDADEQVIADQFDPLLQSLGVNIPVTVLPNMKHTDMIKNPEAIQVIDRVISELQ
jgi:pimeloyl-ACP methyl ester carboxylesterase